MFELTETIDFPELNGGSTEKETAEAIKGGFPRIRICDEEFIKKINERKPREFSKKDILPIKQIIQSKKSEPLFDLLTDSPNSTNIIEGGSNEKKDKINGVLISSIIGKNK